MTVIHSPKNEQPLPVIFAFLSFDADGTEGICSVLIGDMWFPMVTGDESVAEKMKPRAEAIAVETGKSIRLVKYGTREVLEQWPKRSSQ